jgi:capsular exopolysaccharide synthesis family protein
MSRIEEALRRARAGSQDTASPPAATPGAPAASATPPEELVESPWAFDAPAADTKRPAAKAAPRAREATSSSANGGTATFVTTRRPAAPEARPDGSMVPGPQDPDSFGVFGGFDPSVDERVTVSKGIPGVSVEQYRRLAATLHHAQADRGVRSVMITSAVTGEGKSLTATNLALTLSQSYRRRVLLIDADLRRPSMHRIFQVPNVSGLTDGLKQPDERKLAIIEIADRLALLTAGRPDPDPMGGLVSDRMRRILEEAMSKFDWVVIDTPPVALLPDANVLAAMVDVALLVVGATVTPYDLVQRAVDSIGRDKIMGVVLNRVENTGFAGDARYHAYYASYGGNR